MSSKVPKYILRLIKKYPNILSGRKNIKEYHERIVKTKKIIRAFKLKKK